MHTPILSSLALTRRAAVAPSCPAGRIRLARSLMLALAILAANGIHSQSCFADKDEESEKSDASPTKYANIPQMVTSFGAAIVGDELYIYGGHTGRAHTYYREAQANTLRRLDLKSGKWKSLGEGPHLQGLAMVGHRGKLYRMGGFTAKNKDGEEHDLHSQATVSQYDPASKMWSVIVPMPEPRSSFDAAVLGDRIFVIGGWQMQGGSESQWAETAYSLNLSGENSQWEALPKPPFQRRALSVAAHDGKIYAIGGMQEKGGPTTAVDIFVVKKNTWTKGPNLQGEPMNGFGSSAFGRRRPTLCLDIQWHTSTAFRRRL